MMREKTEQEIFWEGKFGLEYTDRNKILASQRCSFFSKVLQKTYGVQSICELGANKGHNLEAIRLLSQNFTMTGVEINKNAITFLKQIEGINAIQSSIQEYNSPTSFDLVFTCGVLIHINPDDLPVVYEKMYELSQRYILINEYFNPTPVEINYRGHTGKLFKRDFAGEMLDKYSQLNLIDYGFLWHRLEPAWDNTSWFLLEKRS